MQTLHTSRDSEVCHAIATGALSGVFAFGLAVKVQKSVPPIELLGAQYGL